MRNPHKTSIPAEMRHRQESLLAAWKAEQAMKNPSSMSSKQIDLPPLTPNDKLKLIGLAMGACMICSGIWMSYAGVQADGSVDIKSALISGSMKADSAGLIIAFLGSCVFMASALLSSKISHKEERSSSSFFDSLWSPRNQNIASGLILIFLFVTAILIANESFRVLFVMPLMIVVTRLTMYIFE